MRVPGSRPLLLLLAVGLLAPLGAPAQAGDAAAAPPSGHKDLVVDRLEHDFGAIRQNARRSAEFTYTNNSDHVVAGIHARGECGCNSVSISETELAPGASGVLTVGFDTLTLGGHLTKHVHLASGDRTRGEIQIALRIAIVEGLVVRPPGLSFGDVIQGDRPHKAFTVRWYEGYGQPFEITAVEVPGYAFSSRIAPYRHAEDPLWRGWEVDLKFEEAPPLGLFSAEVLVRTTHPEYPRLTLPLSANVCGKVWMQSRTLSFGAFAQGTARSASLKFRPFERTVRFDKPRAVARKGKIRVEVRPDPLHQQDGVWRLYGTVPEDAEAGPLDDEVIELHTGLEGEEVTLVKVRGYVRPTRKAPDDGR